MQSAEFRKTAPREKLVPNPKLRLREQVRAVMRFKHFSPQTQRGGARPSVRAAVPVPGARMVSMPSRGSACSAWPAKPAGSNRGGRGSGNDGRSVS